MIIMATRWFVGSIANVISSRGMVRWIAFDPVVQTCLAPVERFLKLGYPLVMSNIAMENGHL